MSLSPELGAGAGASAAGTGRKSEFNLETAQSNLAAIQSRLANVLEEQGKAEDEEKKQKELIKVHKKTIEDLAEQLSNVKDKRHSFEIGDALLSTLPPDSPLVVEDRPEINKLPPHLKKEYLNARIALNQHEAACSLDDIDQAYLNKLLDKLQVGFVQPIVLKYLRENSGKSNVEPHQVMIYVHRVMNMLYSRGVVNIMQKAFPNLEQDGNDNEYMMLVGNLETLCVDACESIHKNDTFSNSIVEYLGGFDNRDLVAALKKTAEVVLAVKTVDVMYPTLLSKLSTFFTLGVETTGIVTSYCLSAPFVTAVVVSNLVVNHETYSKYFSDKASLVKKVLMSCVPSEQFEQGFRQEQARAAAVAQAEESIPVEEKERSCKAVLSDMSAILDPPTAIPRVFAFREDVLLGKIERVITRVVKNSMRTLQGAAGVFMSNPVKTLALNSKDAIESVLTHILSLKRDQQCVRKGNAVATNDMKLAFLKKLAEKLATFDAAVKPDVEMLMHLLSYQIQYLSIHMVELLAAFDTLTHPGVMPFGRMKEQEDPYSQATAGSPEAEHIRRAAALESGPFFTPQEYQDVGLLGDRDPLVPIVVRYQVELPQYSDSELELWQGLLEKLYRTKQSRPEGHEPFESPEERTNPFYRIFKAISSDDAQAAEMVRDVNTMPELKPLLEKFNTYVQKEQQRLAAPVDNEKIIELEVKAAEGESIGANAAACAVAGESISESIGFDDFEESIGSVREREEDEESKSSKPRQSDLSKSLYGGKSRSRKNSGKKVTRRKGVARKQKSKKNKRQSRRRSSIRRARK